MSGAVRRIGLLPLVAAWLLLAHVAPAPALAVDPTFQAATATSTFGESITVEQRVSLPAGVTRVEAYVRSNSGSSIYLAEIDNPGQGAHTLRYEHETPSGSVFPNTRFEVGFRVTSQEGTFIDGPPASLTYGDDRFAWRTIEGDVVRIHWYEGDEGFGRRALEVGERAVEEATTLLGVQETEPIDFFVYADRSAFYDVLGNSLQENVGGLAWPPTRTLFANIAPSEVSDPWVSAVVPHELAHIVFYTATRNPYREPPHWLNEGLAEYLAKGYSRDDRANVERAVRSGDLMPLHALALQFPSTAERFSLGYDESVSAIDYMIRAHGEEALVRLIRSYADGVSDDAAFSAALGVDLAGFEAGWLADLGADTPAPYGPRPAPVGPLPPGWNAAPIATGPPVASPPPEVDERAELGTVIVIGVILLFGVVIVLGILVAARGLNRGETLLQQPTGLAAPPRRWSDEAPSDEAPSDDRAEDRPADEVVREVAELDARFAPPGTEAPESGPDRRPDDR